jgi:hypothetical protein
MDVNYGRPLKNYLLNQVTLLRIHRFDPNDVQFEDAIVSSAILWFRKAKPGHNYQVNFTFGKSIAKPKISRLVSSNVLLNETKWTRFPVLDVRQKLNRFTLSDYFTIKRGIATGDNKFFILPKDKIKEYSLPIDCFRPILPSPRYLTSDEILSEIDGTPCLERQLYLLDCRLPEEEVSVQYPSLWRYLQSGKPAVSGRYLCDKRNPWYSQEDRPASLFICTYMGRIGATCKRPFRFILNNSNATVANVYLVLYPKPKLARSLHDNPALARNIWEILNRISIQAILAEGRVYGGGLYKIEPKELGKVPADELAELLSDIVPMQQKLFQF